MWDLYNYLTSENMNEFESNSLRQLNQYEMYVYQI